MPSRKTVYHRSHVSGTFSVLGSRNASVDSKNTSATPSSSISVASADSVPTAVSPKVLSSQFKRVYAVPQVKTTTATTTRTSATTTAGTAVSTLNKIYNTGDITAPPIRKMQDNKNDTNNSNNNYNDNKRLMNDCFNNNDHISSKLASASTRDIPPPEFPITTFPSFNPKPEKINQHLRLNSMPMEPTTNKVDTNFKGFPNVAAMAFPANDTTKVTAEENFDGKKFYDANISLNRMIDSYLKLYKRPDKHNKQIGESNYKNNNDNETNGNHQRDHKNEWELIIERLRNYSIINELDNNGNNILWLQPKKYSVLHATMDAASNEESKKSQSKARIEEKLKRQSSWWRIATKMIQYQPLLVKCRDENGDYPLVKAIKFFNDETDSSDFRTFILQLIRFSFDILRSMPIILHLSLARRLPHELVILILGVIPMACSIYDDEGFLPLHRLCDTFEPVNSRLLEDVMRIQPRAVVMKTKCPPYLTPMQLLEHNNMYMNLKSLKNRNKANPPEIIELLDDSSEDEEINNEKDDGPPVFKKARSNIESSNAEGREKAIAIDNFADPEQPISTNGVVCTKESKGKQNTEQTKEDPGTKFVPTRNETQKDLKKRILIQNLENDYELLLKEYESMKTKFATKIREKNLIIEEGNHANTTKLLESNQFHCHDGLLSIGGEIMSCAESYLVKQISHLEQEICKLKKNLIDKNTNNKEELNNLRGQLSIKLKEDSQNFHKQFRTKEESQEEKVKAIKNDLQELEKSVLADGEILGMTFDKETIKSEYWHNLLCEKVKANNLKKEKFDTLEKTLKYRCEEYEVAEANLKRHYSEIYETKHKCFCDTLTQLYSQIKNAHDLNKKRAKSNQDEQYQKENILTIPPGTNKEDVAFEFIAHLRDDIQFIEDTIDVLRLEQEKRKEQQKNVPKIFDTEKYSQKNHKNPKIHVVSEEENTGSDIADIMDVINDEESVGSDGALYGIYER